MGVRLDPIEERRARSRAIAAVSESWVDEQLAAGLDGPTPPDRREPSDYSQHVPVLEADGAALDELFGSMPG